MINKICLKNYKFLGADRRLSKKLIRANYEKLSEDIEKCNVRPIVTIMNKASLIDYTDNKSDF